MKLSSLQKGLVGHWPLDQESFNQATKRFTDKSPYSNHGTGFGTQLGGSPTFQPDRMGQLNRAAPFNGTDDYINCGNPDFTTNSQGTVAMWIKPTAIADSFLSFLNPNSGSIDELRFGCYSGNRLHFALYQSATILNLRSNINVFDLNIWSNFVWTSDGSEVKAYINNVQIEMPAYSGTNSGQWFSSANIDANTIIIGALIRSSTIIQSINGNISDIIIYDRELLTDERELLFNSYRPKVMI